MDQLYDAKIIADTKLFEAHGISVKCGRKKIDDLEAQHIIAPTHTPTGRTLPSFREAQAVMAAFLGPQTT